MSTQKTKTIIFRAGDVLVFVIGDSGNGNLLSASKAFDESLRKALSGGICKSLEYSGQETSRSPYSNDDYKGFYTTNKVVIPKVELPKIEDEAKFKQVAIGSKLTSLKEVNIPSKPVSYPVWPELPEEVDKPVEPKTPAKKADTEKKYKQLTEDKVGPGCGWDFTGSIAPVFSKANADKENEETRTRTEEELVEASKEWQASVLTYWEEFDKYEKQAPKWNKYVDEVAEVSEAWDEIKREWNTYYANYDIWLKQVEARDSFLNRQEQAKKSYENAIQECKVWEAEQKQKEADRKKEEEERKKNDESNPDTDSTESPTPTEEPEDENAPQCPAVKPAIIDQAPPSVGAEPTKPADPRPESERD